MRIAADMEILVELVGAEEMAEMEEYLLQVVPDTEIPVDVEILAELIGAEEMVAGAAGVADVEGYLTKMFSDTKIPVDNMEILVELVGAVGMAEMKRDLAKVIPDTEIPVELVCVVGMAGMALDYMDRFCTFSGGAEERATTRSRCGMLCYI